MVYCKHDVNHQSITYHSEDDDNYGWDCNSDLNVEALLVPFFFFVFVRCMGY